MHSDEWNELVECIDCGAGIRPATDRAFAVDDDRFLCFDCAVRRGGVYDAAEDRWTVAPEESGIPATEA